MVTTSPLRTAAISCLVIWVAIWLMFLLMRFSLLDIRLIPGIGPIMLVALAIAVLAPIVATVLAVAVLVGQSRVPLNWILLGCATAGVVCVTLIFSISRWL